MVLKERVNRAYARDLRVHLGCKFSGAVRGACKIQANARSLGSPLESNFTPCWFNIMINSATFWESSAFLITSECKVLVSATADVKVASSRRRGGLLFVPLDFTALKHCWFLLSSLKRNSSPKLFLEPRAADHCYDFNVRTAFGSQTVVLFRLLIIAARRHILKRDYFTSLLHCHAQTGFDECRRREKKSPLNGRGHFTVWIVA